MKHDTICNKKGCQNLATHYVRLSLAVHANHEPAISTPIVTLCKEHADQCTWQSLQIDNNWDMICKSIESIGRVAPVKEFSKLIIEPININESNNNSTLS